MHNSPLQFIKSLLVFYDGSRTLWWPSCAQVHCGENLENICSLLTKAMHPAINWLVLQTAPHTLTLRAQNEEKECTLHVCTTQQTLKCIFSKSTRGEPFVSSIVSQSGTLPW